MVRSLQIASFAIVACLSFSTQVLAQNGKVFSLEECIDIAMKNNSDYKNAVNRVNRAGANVKGSYSSILPQITASLQSGRNVRGSTQNVQDITDFVPLTLEDVNGTEHNILATRLDPTTGGPVIDRAEFFSPTRSFWGHSITLRYNQTLFDFGQSWNTIKQSKAAYEASSASLTAARQDVYATVEQRYLELLKAIKLEQEYRLAVERSKEELNRTKSMYEIGSVAQIDVYRQEVVLGTDEINLINQQNIVEIASSNLNVAMGRDPQQIIHIQDIDPQLSTPDFSLEEAYTIAERNNPELQQFESEMKSADYGRKVAKGSFWPSIGIGASYTRNNEEISRVYGPLDQNFFLSIGAQMDLNIFNGFSDVAEVQRESANYSIAKENWVAQKRQMQLNVKQAYLNLEAFMRISDINEKRLRSAEEEYRLAQERYRVGAGTQLEVTDAQVSLTRARVQLVSSKYDALIARAQLEAAMGTLAETEAAE